MRLSVQFPLKTESENKLRSLPFAVANAPASKRMGMAIGIANRVKKQRAAVRLVLDSQLPRLRQLMQDGPDIKSAAREVLIMNALSWRPNFYRVRLIRISAGVLDDDGLRGALKAVRDEVAAWLGVDDGPRAPVRFAYAQQKGPAKVYAIRLEIEDDDPDPREVHRIVGPPIARLGQVLEEGPHPLDEHLRGNPGDRMHAPADRGAYFSELSPRVARARAQRRSAEEQAPLVFRRAFYALPEEQTPDELTLHELTALPGGDNPPVRVRIAGRLYVRRLETDPALGEFWIYEAAPSAAPAAEERAST